MLRQLLRIVRGTIIGIGYVHFMPKKSDVLLRFGLRVKLLRKECGFSSQEALADACGLDRTYIGGIERGERNLSLENVARIAKALKTTISELTRSV